MDGWVGGWVDGWVDGWMGGWMDICVLAQPDPSVFMIHAWKLHIQAYRLIIWGWLVTF